MKFPASLYRDVRILYEIGPSSTLENWELRFKASTMMSVKCVPDVQLPLFDIRIGAIQQGIMWTNDGLRTDIYALLSLY